MAMSLVRQHGPRLIRELTKKSTTRPAPGRSQPPTRGGGAAGTTQATATQARRIDYSPALDGAADPGEVVWTWVRFEDDPDQGKDRPVLVVGRNGSTLLGLMLSSQTRRGDDPHWMSVGTGDWDSAHRESFVRLDRVLFVAEDGIRREGAILPRAQFDRVATVLRRDHHWQ
jgi:hypothetical protein